MRRLLVAVLILGTSCSTEVVGTSTSTTETSITSSSAPSTTSTATSTPPAAAGQLIRLEMPTLRTLQGMEPIPIVRDTWGITSPDGSLAVVFSWDEAAQVHHGSTIDVQRWRQVASFDHLQASGMSIDENQLFSFDHQSGELVRMDVLTGQESVLADWSPHHWLYEGPIVLPGGRVALLATEPVGGDEEASFSVLIYDVATQTKIQHPVGALERMNPTTGVFDGEYEIPERDDPGVAWGDDRLFLAYMDGPEVIEIDLETGDTETHLIELSSWLDRLWAFWNPTARAKGPSLGTYTSAAISADGRYLFISGNEQTIEVVADGTLVEESEHLGLIVVDTETWRPVASPDLPIQHVRRAGSQILGVDTTSFQPWISDYYLLSMESKHPRVTGPLTVTEGSCEQSADRRYLLCTEYSPVPRIRVIDVETLDTLGERAIGHEDTLLPNGVLVDYLPRSEP